MYKLSYRKGSRWKYELLADFTIKSDTIDFGRFKAYAKEDMSGRPLVSANGNTFTVHAGYTWDGCTGVPTYDWNLAPSLVHDALYQVKKNNGGDACKASWYQVDRLFLVMMKADDANWLQRNTYYAGVRTFGFFFKFEKFHDLRVVRE